MFHLISSYILHYNGMPLVCYLTDTIWELQLQLRIFFFHLQVNHHRHSVFKT